MTTTAQKLTLAALAAAATACTPVRTVYIYQPQPTAIPVAAATSCQQHAGMAQAMRYGSNFQILQIDPVGLLTSAVAQRAVGTQPVALALDGTADLWRQGEYRRVHWHCLVNDHGQALYSYVRSL